MDIEYHPLTISDVLEAVQYYESKQKGLGDRFKEEVYTTIEKIQYNPYMYAENNKVRRAIVKRFPYTIIFRITIYDSIRILTIRHFKRDPQYGSTRI